MSKAQDNRVSVTIELDKQVYDKLNAFCQKMGFSPQIAFEVFANRLVREGRYPFPIVKEDFPGYGKNHRLSKLAKASFSLVQKASVSALHSIDKAMQARRERKSRSQKSSSRQK